MYPICAVCVFKQDEWVWMPHEQHMFIPARVTERGPSLITCEDENGTVKKKSKKLGCVSLRVLSWEQLEVTIHGYKIRKSK